MKYTILFILFSYHVFSQVGVNTTYPQAQLDITASNAITPSNTDGLLIPRIAAFPIANPSANQQGMMVYLTTTVGLNTPGFYFWDNTTTSWKTLGDSVVEIDPKVGSTNGNYIPKWNGTTLVDGAIYDDNTNVGIGLIPTKRFQVHTGVSPSSSITVDHLSGAIFNNTVTQRWQSFTATFNGELERVLLQFNNVSVASNRTISVYLGEGTSGTLLYNGSPVSVPVSGGVSGVSFNLTGVVVSTGIKYTIAIDDGSRWLYASGDEYAGGIGSNGAANDYRFRLFGFQNNDGFSVSNVGVAINNYLLPKYDGIANQILQTDGTGNVSWVNPTSLTIPETDPQVSSTTTNYIPKWNGTTLIDGQVFDNGTNVGIGTLTPTDKVHVVGNIKVDGGKLPFVNTGNSVFIGENAGAVDDLTNNQNTFIGYNSGTNVTTGSNNTFLGGNSGLTAISANSNVAIGSSAFRLGNGNNNVAIGNSSLSNSLIGSGNVALGFDAGNRNTGDYNVFIGRTAGFYNTGSKNIFIGDQAGFFETTSEKLYIDNNPTGSPLIYGDFANDILAINGNVGIGTTTPTQAKLVISGFNSNSVGNFGQFKNDGTGSVNTTGTPYAYSIYASNRIAASEFNAFSDARIKNIKGITNNKQDLETLSKIEITNYTLKDSISKGNNNYKKVIAQQIEKVYPQAVNKLTDVIPDIYKQAELKKRLHRHRKQFKSGGKNKNYYSKRRRNYRSFRI